MADPLIDLSVYRLKSSGAGIESVVTAKGLVRKVIDFGGGQEGYLHIKKPIAKPPKWAQFFEGSVDFAEFGKGASTAAVLLIDIDSSWFAIAFGTSGRFLIDQDAIEERFGLLTVLNSIPYNNVRSIDKTSFDSRGTQSHVQASKEAPPQEFGLDVERDLVRGVAGTPTEPALGARLHGKDALRATLSIDLAGLPAQLTEYGKRSQSNKYKKHFPWVDHIAAISDIDLVERLNERAIELIHAHDEEKCWLAVPERIDWDAYLRFQYGGSKKKNALHHDISFDSWVSELNQSIDGGFTTADVDLAKLSSTTVKCLNENDDVTHRWSLYKCVYAEVDYQQRSYLLTSGQWYRVDKEFVEEVDAFYKSISPFEIAFPEYNDECEGDYNTRICGASNGAWALMDQKNITMGAGQTPIEFCDVYTGARDIVHVKRYGQSRSLSHHFAQGTVSGELFRTSATFRSLVNAKLPDSHKLADHAVDPDQGEYQVVYAVVSDKPGPALTLPFFSRLNLRAATIRLRGFGYRVALAKIAVNDVLKLTKKYIGG